jgi:uncharacterized protein
MGLKFEWDKNKAAANIKKHGIAFDEAVTVFSDPVARIFYDLEHSLTEDREIIIGHSVNHRLLLVCFIERSRDVVRIFSARRATKKERKDYEENSFIKNRH